MTIGSDVPCIVCGYNLRGLDRAGVCPECGSAVERSFRGDLLRYANEDWLRRLSLGLNIASWSMQGLLLAILVGMILLFVVIALEWSGLVRASSGPADWLMALPCGLVLIAVIVWPIGVTYSMWLMSAPEPRGGTEGWLRPMVFRWSCVLVAPAIWAWLYLGTTSPRGQPPIDDPMIMLGLGIVFMAIIATHAVMLLDYLRVLERRSVQPVQLKDAKPPRDTKLRQMRTRVLTAFIVLAVVCMPPYWSSPGDVPPLAIFAVIVWMIAMSAIDKTSDRVAAELAASRLEKGASPPPS